MKMIVIRQVHTAVMLIASSDVSARQCECVSATYSDVLLCVQPRLMMLLCRRIRPAFCRI